MIFQLSEVPEFYKLTSISLDDSYVPPPLTKFENWQIVLLLTKTVDLYFSPPPPPPPPKKKYIYLPMLF